MIKSSRFGFEHLFKAVIVIDDNNRLCISQFEAHVDVAGAAGCLRVRVRRPSGVGLKVKKS
jgi:hypothetical protein